MHDWPEFTIIVRLWIVAGLLAMLGLGILRRFLEDCQGGVIVAIRQKDLRTETRPTRVVAAPRVKKRGLFQPMPRGVANGRVLLLITTLLVTFGTIAVRRPARVNRRPTAARRGRS